MQNVHAICKYKSYIFLYLTNTGGNKNKLINALVKHKKTPNREKEYQSKLEELLEPTGMVEDEELPQTIQHYKHTFNGVDRFSAYLGHFPWPYKVEKPEFLFFISCLRMAVINAWLLELNYDGNVREADDVLSLKNYISKLSNELMQNK